MAFYGNRIEARLDDLRGKQFCKVQPVRVAQYAALFRAYSVAPGAFAIDLGWPRTHTIHVRLFDHAGTNLIALLNTIALDSEEPIFGCAAIPADELLPLLRLATDCSTGEQFESLIFKAFELASRRSKTNGSVSPLRMQRLKRFIEQESHHDLTLERMAKVVGLSKFACLRKFKEATGTTPHAYLMECRIRGARTLLSMDRASIAAVADATGFCDQAYFARVFKKSTGLTPMQYRNIVNDV